MSITKISGLCTLFSLAFPTIALHAQGGGATSQRSLASISPQGLQLQIEQSALTGGGGAQYSTSGPTLVWRYESDGTWLAGTVGLGDHGSQVFSEHGTFVNRTLLISAHDGNPPIPVWTDEVQVENFARMVSSAAEANVHVAIHQEFVDDLKIVRQTIVNKYTSSAATPDWTWTSPVGIVNHDYTEILVSGDGETIALVIHDSSANGARLTLLDPVTGAPVLDQTLDTFGIFQTAQLSPDGSTLALASALKLLVFDLPTATVVHEAFLFTSPQYGALALSGDGSLLATGTLGSFTLLQRGAAGGYSTLFTEPLAGSTFCRRLALSADGSTVVAGLQLLGDKNTVLLRAFDTASQEMTLDLEFAGTGGYDNLIQEIDCSDNGLRFAVGLWGDEGQTVPEVLLYQREMAVPLVIDDLPGSVTELELSGDGRWLAVSSKGVHANVWGGGGAISLYAAGFVDLCLTGTPSLGKTMLVEHQLREGATSTILIATALADEPISDHAYGSGLLYLDPATTTVLGIDVADENNVAMIPFSLSDDPLEIGQVYYLQGWDLESPRLSANWVKVTVLP